MTTAHNVLKKICPVFLREKKLQAIATIEKVDRKKAVEAYKILHRSSQHTFSSIIKSISAPNNSLPT